MKRIGLALGGGGVRGLAHVLVLELLDEMGHKPVVISGTSMGAIIGALYASGLSGKAIRERICAHITARGHAWRELMRRRSEPRQWLDACAQALGFGRIVKTDRFLRCLLTGISRGNFSELDIPLIVIAADYWGAEEVVLGTGDLLSAVRASMAIPGVLAPVCIDGRVLVDGGFVNLVPFDHIMDRCDLSIAVNVARIRTLGRQTVPGKLESILGTIGIMQAATLAEKAKHRQPGILFRPDIRDVRMFDFGKVEDVFRQTALAVDGLREKIAKAMAEPAVAGNLDEGVAAVPLPVPL